MESRCWAATTEKRKSSQSIGCKRHGRQRNESDLREYGLDMTMTRGRHGNGRPSGMQIKISIFWITTSSNWNQNAR